MTLNGWLQILLFSLAVLAVTKPLGAYMFRVFEGERQPLPRILGPLERGIYRLGGVDPRREQEWREYAFSLILFSGVTLLITYLIQRLQHVLPLNPQKLGPVPPWLAFNTAASFTTNTNWQAYGGETTMSYLTQMAGLAWHNFISAAAGLGVALALARGLTRKLQAGESPTLGNFWVDLIRATLYVLLPLSILLALLLVSQGVIQNFSAYREVTTLEGAKQVLPMGPVASQEAIKELGTNGGGFFNTNSAHPFENPTPLTNFLQMLAIFSIPAALTYTYGRMAGRQKEGWVLFGAMAVLFLAGVTACYWAEAQGNPVARELAVTSAGNMEGKEVRFGVANSALFATVTTDASCGAVNAMHDSFTALGGLVPLLNIQLGEIVFGGVGAGLYGMLVFTLLTVFLAGLMVGRTPEYLGKKIEPREMKLVMLYVLIFPLLILVLAAWSVVAPYGVASLNNAGPHGLSEILYAFTSGTGNNGSAFAGLNANTDWYNITLGLAMLAGRFLMILPLLALAGSMAEKKTVPAGPGTFPTDSGLFLVLLVAVVLIVGALTFFPALSLGPIVEHFLALNGKVF
ncbi:MAG TPA: potassium-transporting ATPase subunit KdpA [Candidatus Sumerlaeota bacterium]|nr:potassium-transporting ATPase subunit KdpA [Candidatus Sumerlaeota bacterium]